MTVYTFQCTDCKTENSTYRQPPDCMVTCQKCGYRTVQLFVNVEHRGFNAKRPVVDVDLSQ